MALLNGPIPLPELTEQPLVSVLMASYNYEQYLGRALNSVLAQTYPHWECIVCDDGSTDASRDIAAGYARQDERVHLLAQPNGGVASALNAAYQQSKGSIVCLLDADDFFAPDKLAQVVQHFQWSRVVGMVLHAMQVVDGQEGLLYQIPFADNIEEGWIAEKVMARGGRWRSMPTSALAFRRTIAEHLFPIPEAAFRSEADGFLYTLAPLLTSVAFLPEPLSGYRIHGSNLTGASRLDATVVARYLDALDRKNSAVNERLGELGISDIQLLMAHHLNGQEHRFIEALFADRPRTELLRAYVPLAKAVLADDLYPPLRKALGVMVLGGAIVLPVSARAPWLSALLGGVGLRRAIQVLGN